MSRINVMQPFLGAEEIAAVTQVLSSGWVAQGPRVAAFEAAFAGHQEADHAVAVSSCTTALHLSLIVSGVHAGDDVVVPSFSFIATANAPVYVGALPVFADVDALTGKLNRGEGSLAQLINDGTLFNRLNTVTERLDQLTTGLNAGEGSAGQFLKNKQVYDNLNSAVNELKGLITDIRKDPKKYLNVKVSIF